jgi:hypothetical protein
MNRNTVKILLAALCLTTACETWPQQVPAHSDGDLAAPPRPSTGDDCAGCYKWSSRPPSGINGPVLR